MKKNPGTNEASAAEGAATTDVVFTGDALVVDYLTTLLTSAPAKSLDSGEINMIHLAIEAGWKLVGATGEASHTAQNFESDLSKLEAETLKNEIKHLKFKAELAHIDAQVLRSENGNLKSELATMKARIHQIQSMFETLVAENTGLKSLLEVLQNRPDPSDEPPTEEAPPCSAAPPQELEAGHTEEAEPEQTDAGNAPDDAAVGMDEAEPIPAAAQDSAAHDPIRDTPPPTAPAATPRINDNACSGGIEERAFISRAHTVQDPANLKSDRTMVLTSRTHTAAAMPVQSFRPASKVIKQQDIEKQQNRQENSRPTVILAPQPAHQHTPPPETGDITETARTELAEQNDTGTEENPATHHEALPPDATAEIDVPPAPAPKVVVRRNVMNYEDLQKEADSGQSAATGHTIIL